MAVIICPGFHPPDLTSSFLRALGRSDASDLVFPADRQPPYSAIHILGFLHSRLGQPDIAEASSLMPWEFPKVQPPLLWIGFSAGVVGAIGAAHMWQGLGGQVKALIALDGWGIPLYGNFPIHRLSHDRFTHQTSVVLEGGVSGGISHFYADPAVEHLNLWRSPQTTHGYQAGSRHPATAATFLQTLLHQYNETTPNL